MTTTTMPSRPGLTAWGLLLAAFCGGCCCLQREEAARLEVETASTSIFLAGTILQQPADLLLPLDQAGEFSVRVSPGLADNASYQWFLNGRMLPGQTSTNLTVIGTTNAVGFYNCLVTVDPRNEDAAADPKGPPRSEMSQPASLMVWWDGSIIVQGTPVPSRTTSGTCPPPYVGYIKFTTSSGGYLPLSPNPDGQYSIRDLQATNTYIRYWGNNSAFNTGCNPAGGGVFMFPTAPSPLTARYTFVIYFPRSAYTSVPTQPYRIELKGFRP